MPNLGAHNRWILMLKNFYRTILYGSAFGPYPGPRTQASCFLHLNWSKGQKGASPTALAKVINHKSASAQRKAKKVNAICTIPLW